MKIVLGEVPRHLDNPGAVAAQWRQYRNYLELLFAPRLPEPAPAPDRDAAGVTRDKLDAAVPAK